MWIEFGEETILEATTGARFISDSHFNKKGVEVFYIKYIPPRLKTQADIDDQELDYMLDDYEIFATEEEANKRFNDIKLSLGVKQVGEGWRRNYCNTGPR